MEAETELLACRSRADLRRLRGRDSSSSPFITLACKHNRPDLLKLLLEDDTISRRCSVEQEDQGHNALYYAIRSGNVDLFRTLLELVTPELSEVLISEAYEKIFLNSVLVSSEMNLCVQCKLVDLRFFSKDNGVVPEISSTDIQERVQLLLENIEHINTYEEVDNHFLFMGRFIAHNIHILKQQLKSTYNILPWKEIEFCLVSFISAHVWGHELNIFCLSVLRKERLMKQLSKFASALRELQEHIGSTDVKTLGKPVKLSREDVVAAIISRYPDLYADYQEVRDVSSLHIMKTYLEAAVAVDSATRVGQLTIKRALQVTGEHLKNTLDSPKLSPAVTELILLSAPRETKKVMQALRNLLSHPHLESEDSAFYSDIQNDIKKIAAVIIDITNSNKADKIKRLLTTLVNCDNADEFHKIANILLNVGFVNVQETDTVTKDHRKIEDLIADINRNIEDQTPYEKKLFVEIKDVLKKTNLQQQLLTKEEYSSLFKIVLPSVFLGLSIKTFDLIGVMKAEVNEVLEVFSSQNNPLNFDGCRSLQSLLLKFYNSVSMRIKPEIADDVILAVFRIGYSLSIDKGKINCIDEYSRQLLLSKKNKNDNRNENCNVNSVKSRSEINCEQLTLKLKELENIIGTDRMFGQLFEHLSLIYEDKNSNRFTIEALVLDIMSLLDSSKCVPKNGLYLDGAMPAVNGKCLRNHLAHGTSLVDILPTDVWSAVLLNAVKLTENKHLLLNRKIGHTLKHDIEQLRRRYKRGLSILDKKKEMWKCLLDGNFENFVLGIAGGADICSRHKDQSTTLHYAARGPNIEIIKFLIKQKMIVTEARDADGRTALHVAATFGRDDTVKFLVAEIGNAISQVDYNKKTPLHLASQNGHKITVRILLSLGADITAKDSFGCSSLHYAVMNNHLEVVRILSEKDVAVDINHFMWDYTSLHLAAEFGHVEIVRYLLLNEADFNAKTKIGTSPLHLAARSGHLEVVNALLEKGAHVNLRDCQGHSSLYYAVECNHKGIVQILLEKGAFVNNGSVSCNNTPLHMAVSNGNAFITDLLLHHKADVNAKRSDNGFTPLLLAVGCGHADIVDLLLQNGARADIRDFEGSSTLHIAALYDRSSVVETLIQNGIDVDIQNTDQETPLHLAARAGNIQVVDILLAAGADVHSVDAKDCTALHYSAAKGQGVISEALIKKGADVNCKSKTLICTPLHIAAAITSIEKTIQMLLNNGASVNEKGKFGFTALHAASLFGNSSVVEALLQEKADVNAEDDNGDTSLHIAASGNHKATVEVLLKYGANINHLNTAGSSALCCAAKNNNKDLLDMLIAKGADVNVGGGKLLLSAITAGHRLVVEALLKNKDLDININNKNYSLLHAAAVSGDVFIAKALIGKGIKVADCIEDPSPLHTAITLGNTEFVEVLLENGANVNPTDSNYSPLHHAVLMNTPDIVERLLHWGADSKIRNSCNRTPLEVAVAKAQLSNTSTLLQLPGVKINERYRDDWTLLHIAAEAGNLEVATLLVGQGADINAINRQGCKPIQIAALNGHLNVLTFFLELGMSIDDTRVDGCTLIHCAAMRGQLAVTQYLIDNHLDFNSTDFVGAKPIHFSARNGHTEMVKLLLQSGAVYDATDKCGNTPSDLTKSRDIKELLSSIEKLFKSVKKNDVLKVGNLVKDLAKYVNVKSSDNATLLHIASWKGFEEVCDILLKSKANPNSVGKGGNAPLHYASKYSHPGIVKSLLKNGAEHNLKANNTKTPLDFATQKDIKSLLQTVARCFRKVKIHDVQVIKDITKISDIEIVKAVMKARNTDGDTLVVVAMKYRFPHVGDLKQVLQPNVVHFLSTVDSMFMSDRSSEALNILNRLLSERIEILGEDNPGTLDIQDKIANALHNMGKYPDALTMLKDIYKVRVKVSGPNHLDTLETRSHLALLLSKLGKKKEAWDICQEVLKTEQELLGEGHEQVMQTKVRAALILEALGRYEEALRFNVQVYKRYRSTLGIHHPDTLCSQFNIATVFQSQGKFHEAFALLQTVYEARKKELGLNHSDTLRTRRTIAAILTHQNKLDEALQICQEILPIQKNVLGLDNVETVNTQMVLEIIYAQQKNNYSALMVHKEGLSARNAFYGPDHPSFRKSDAYLDKIEKNLKYSTDIGYKPPCDFNLLNAASEGDRGEVYRLLENGSDVNTMDSVGRTVLHFAATVEVMSLLLDNGADPTAVSQKGNTPLHLAASKSCIQRVRLLLQNVKKNRPKAYHKFINAKTVVGGSTALHVATEKGAADIVSCLLEHGACYNVRDRSDNRTPLQSSCNGSVTRLLRLAEEVFEIAKRGGTVLPQGDESQLAAVVNSRDSENRTPLQLAIVNGHTDTAKLLASLLKTSK